jgi:hypothetical protein
MAVAMDEVASAAASDTLRIVGMLQEVSKQVQGRVDYPRGRWVGVGLGVGGGGLGGRSRNRGL